MRSLLSPSLKRVPVLIDCHSADNCVVPTLPFTVGATTTSHWRIVGDGLSGGFFILQSSGGKCMLCPALNAEVIFDGRPISSPIPVSFGEDHTIAVKGQFFLLRMTSVPEDWLNHVNPHQWFIHNLDNGSSAGPYGWTELPGLLRQMGAADNLMVHPFGMATGFFASQILAADADAYGAGDDPMATLAPAPRQQAAVTPTAPREPAASSIDSEHGEFTCPVCWLKFDRGDVMNIAVHASLRGDPLLGESAMQRFHATRFNDKNQALDAMNLPTSDQACPHCRRKLPPGFLDTPHYIFSIVGDTESGKSYYLSVLIKKLQQALFTDFNLIFRDADPSENVFLTTMKNALFSAGTPEEAYLAKTDLEGDLYETLPRYGRKVRLPKPFIYRLSSAHENSREASIVFYDNAGEHFQPTRNSADSPGAQHIAVASGIFFLFDPLHSAEFRARLNGATDPQLTQQRTHMDQQDVILAETEVRIKSLLGLDASQKVMTPFAFLVGKCDTWLPLLGPEPLLPAVVGSTLHLDNIRANSLRIRELMIKIAAPVVANAEAISSNVMYFAISPLGTSPIKFVDSHDGSTKLAPDPKLLDPKFVEVPTLWVLSQLISDLIPSS